MNRRETQERHRAPLALALVGAVAIATATCTWIAAEPVTAGSADQAMPVTAKPVVLDAEAIAWETRASGVRVAVLHGNPSQSGPFVLRLQYPPGYEKGPHYHPGHAYITVLDGSYSRGYGAVFDRTAAFPLLPGTFSINPRGVSHYEWTEDGASLQVFAQGPWRSVYVDAEDRPTDASEVRLEPSGSPIVRAAPELEWSEPVAKKRSALLHGDPQQAGPFALRAELQPGHREEPHTHPVDAFVTMLRGSMRLGFGETFDTKQMVELSAGAFFVIPAGTPHFQSNDESTWIEVHATGPWASTDVGAALSRSKQ